MPNENISVLLGKTLAQVSVNETKDEVWFAVEGGDSYRMWHRQDCCENVSIESIVGDLDDLLDSPILLAEEVSSENTPEEVENPYESFTWTFYKLSTIKGSVTISWFGESNGYYSESVDFVRVA